MAKRRMPPHIVLPNGQWRFVKRGAKTNKTRRRVRGVSMARRKSSRRSGFGGIAGMLMPAVAGAAVGYLAPQIPVLNTLPYSRVIGGAVGGFIAKRSVMGAAIGAASGAVVPNLLNGGAASGNWSF